jgi:hypothetical protein
MRDARVVGSRHVDCDSIAQAIWGTDQSMNLAKGAIMRKGYYAHRRTPINPQYP